MIIGGEKKLKSPRLNEGFNAHLSNSFVRRIAYNWQQRGALGINGNDTAPIKFKATAPNPINAIRKDWKGVASSGAEKLTEIH